MTNADVPPLAASDREVESAPRREVPSNETASCDVCGAPDVMWIRCKLVCRHCHTILMTCGDL